MNTRLIICLLTLLFIKSAAAQKLERIFLTGVTTLGTSPVQYTVVDDKLFFAATDSSNRAGLFVTLGLDATARKLTPPGTVGTLDNLTAFNGKLYFSCDDGVHGRELWVSDGTTEGTKLYADIYSGNQSSNPAGLTATGKMLFFLARNSAVGTKMFSTDGGINGVFLLRSQQVYFFDNLGGFAVLNDDVFFKGSDGTGLWKSDGTVQGTVMINGNITPMCPGAKYGILNSKLFFMGRDLQFDQELWATDGTAQGTYLVKDIYPGTSSSLPNGFTLFNNSLYFSATDDTHGEELFVTDGTTEGTLLVKDLTPGAGSSRPSQMIVNNDTLYISCVAAKQLWKSNGQEANTTLISSVNDPWYFGAAWNNTVYANAGPLGSYLYKTSGTAGTTGLATAVNVFDPISSYNPGNRFTVFKGSLYFTGSCPGVSDYREPLRLAAAVVTNTYTFTGTGNWSNPANWAGGHAPASTLLLGDTVLISENCVLDISVHAQAGSSITVAAGKNLLIKGALTFQ